MLQMVDITIIKVNLQNSAAPYERETWVNNIEQRFEAYNNLESLDKQKFQTHPIPSEKRNHRQLPKIITDPTKLAIISDYNRINHYVSNKNNNYDNNYSLFNRDNIEIEKLMEIKKSIVKQEVTPMQVPPGICPNCNGPIDEKYYEQNSKSLTWQKRLDILHSITAGLTRIHINNLVHQNLHSGNVLIHSSTVLLSDLGFYKLQNDVEEGLYCVLPFTAPETLRNKVFTKESNIYSFGMIMWELAYCKKPFSDRAHNLDLAIDICEGFHPASRYRIPECYFDIMNQCLSLDPFMRPTAEQLYKTFGKWLCMLLSAPNSYIAEQFQGTEEGPPLFNNKFEVHPEAMYNSRYYNFKELESLL
ncbi:11480_t:CDS:2 [Racocetra fulgida]|uniref:11480_t:CDS:1 n=1 Tax=Racocetra fulgida TaxID=60492 RepID=A0A9N9AQC9_9GLOM|nr:11480_t:CDS:2 [Racocetra fulgida]